MDPRVFILFIACAVSFFAGVRFEAYDTEIAEHKVTKVEKAQADAVIERQLQNSIDLAVFDAVLEKKDEEAQKAIAARDAHYQQLVDRLRREAAASRSPLPGNPETPRSNDGEAEGWRITVEDRADILAIGLDCEADADALKLAQEYVTALQGLNNVQK